MTTASPAPPAIDADAQPRLDDGGGSPTPLPDGGGNAAGDDGLPGRRCGRCLNMFEGDPALPRDVMLEWWLCPPCRLTLLGDRPRRPTKETSQASVGMRRAP
jgi:hypothetical protein